MNFVVVGLAEIDVPRADGGEAIRREHAHHVVGHTVHRLAGVGRADGCGHHHLPRVELPHGLHGGAHRGAGGEPVVHQNHGAPLDEHQRTALPVQLLASIELTHLHPRHGFEGVGRRPIPGHDFIVEHLHPAARNRAHCQLGVARHAELAHREDVERHMERCGHFIADGHAAPWQRQNNHVVAPGVTLQ